MVARPCWLVSLSLLAACTQAKKADGPSSNGQPSAPFAAKLDRAVEDAFSKRDMPGGALVVVQGDKVVYSRGFGFADLATKRPYTDTTPTVIGSTSKPLTALAVLRLVQLGRVALDTPISRYIPDLKFTDPRGAAITLRHLLTNRSGMVQGFSGAAYQDPPIQDSTALDRQSRIMVTLPLNFAPGQGYTYSNRGWTLAGYIVQRVAAQPVEDFMRREVFDPLGMSETTLEFWKVRGMTTGYTEGRQVHNIPTRASLTRGYGPSGMVASTPRDMGRLLIAMLNAGKTVSGTQFLTPGLIHEATRAQAEAESELGGPTKYGLGWEVDSSFGALTVKKAGSVGSMVTLWAMLPDQKLGLAFAFNREDYKIVPLVGNVLKIIAGGDVGPFPESPLAPWTPPVPVKIPASSLSAWLGTYDTREGDMTITRRGDSLFADYAGFESVLVPASPSSFVMVTDHLKEEGRVVSFKPSSRGVTVWIGEDSMGIAAKPAR